jgi:hypothetical protein
MNTSNRRAKTPPDKREELKMKNLKGRLAKVGLVLGGLGVAGVMAAGPSFASVTNTPIANGVSSTSGNSALTGNQGKGMSVTHYDVKYQDPLLGWVECVGNHQVSKNTPNGQDSFTCTSTQGGLTTFYGGEQIPTLTSLESIQGVASPGWYSDYNGAPAQSFSGSVAANNMSYTAVATY